ncbi:unnamed protein product [Dibothriocephalus latus]|uniref:Uncharacterized protein n=1 Tax=Dibothriocephalus latus TaxID=60516 RepID=A0A3P7L6S5_DIBLA|nr:unnamed protein product [Dibothriocephalus latus]
MKGTPTYGLAKWLFRRLEFLIADSEITVHSSKQFLEKLKGDLAVKTIDCCKHNFLTGEAIKAVVRIYRK